MKYRIVLADDEPFILRGIKKMVDWDKLNAIVVGQAENGEDLLNIIEELEPDIVVSDISMPGLTGLDVLKKLHNSNKKTKVIFLSAFQEFEYAKKAIKFGAVEYILKPVEKDELHQAILEAEKQIYKERYGIGDEFLEVKSGNEEEGIKKDNGQIEARACEEYVKKNQLQNVKLKFVSICFMIHPEDTFNNDKNRLELMKFSVFNYIKELVETKKMGFGFRRDDKSCSGIFVLKGSNPKLEVSEMVIYLKSKLKQHYQQRVVTGIGQIIEDVTGFESAYKTANWASQLYYFTREENIKYWEVEYCYRTSFEDYSKAFRSFLNRLLSNDEDVYVYLEECLQAIENIHFGNRYAAENRSISMIWELYKELMKYKKLEKNDKYRYEKIVEQCGECKTFLQLKKKTKSFIEEIIATMSDEKDAIRVVKQYIEENYANNISLSDASDLVYMNRYYFSSFFKKETGENFKSYLTRVRMKEAMRLLQTTDMKTYELSNAVGYKDVTTFTEKFKNIYGASPAAYKKRC